jgi:hypothetical protein
MSTLSTLDRVKNGSHNVLRYYEHSRLLFLCFSLFFSALFASSCFFSFLAQGQLVCTVDGANLCARDPLEVKGKGIGRVGGVADRKQSCP